MLKEGKFIKEEPPKIGAHYSLDVHQRKLTPEEYFAQDVILGINPYNTTTLERLIGKLLQL